MRPKKPQFQVDLPLSSVSTGNGSFEGAVLVSPGGEWGAHHFLLLNLPPLFYCVSLITWFQVHDVVSVSDPGLLP